MAPTALFDKSFLQSLSLDESVLFGNFFNSIICPIFYTETLADLEKSVRARRTPEEEVGVIADKVPEMHVAPNLYHGPLGIQNLLGTSVPMDGRMIASGKTVSVDGHLGVIHRPPPEAEAFRRWQDREFLEVERRVARRRREDLRAIDLSAVAAGMRAFGINPQNCASLQQAKQIADWLIAGESADLIKLAAVILNADRKTERVALDLWKASGRRSFAAYAPYAAHIVAVEVFFQIALGANLIGTARASNRTDIAYLFYLPFCNIFLSTDRLHQKCAPLFMRDDQSFVWGQELKADLQRLVTHYSALPEAESDEGVLVFASTPPRNDDECVVGKLWDRHVRQPWRRKPESISPEMLEWLEPALREITERFALAPEVDRSQIMGDLSNAGMIETSARIRPKKGSFWQGPKRLADHEHA